MVLLGAAACSGDDDDDAGSASSSEGQDSEGPAADPSELAEVIHATTAESFRFDVVVALGAAPADGSRPDEDPLVTGSSDGERLHIRFEGNSPVAGLLLTFAGSEMSWLPADGDLDRTIDLVLDGEAAYIRSPLFTAIGQIPPGGADAPPQPVVDLAAQIGDGWGRIDRAQLDTLLPAPLQQWTPGEGVDAATVTDFLDSLGELRRLDPTDIDGQDVSGYGVDASLDEAFGFFGMDPASLPLIGSLLAGDLAAEELPAEMWVSGDSRFRRLRIPLVADHGLPPVDVTLDVVDHGDATIAVEAPAGAVDVSGDFAAALVALVTGSTGT